jgi:hypothetical protein
LPSTTPLRGMTKASMPEWPTRGRGPSPGAGVVVRETRGVLAEGEGRGGARRNSFMGELRREGELAQVLALATAQVST